jgi:hypothetical protein
LKLQKITVQHFRPKKDELNINYGFMEDQVIGKFNMPIKRYLTEEEAWRVIGFLQNCLSQLKVSAQFAISQTIIRCLWTSHGQTNSINQRQKG